MARHAQPPGPDLLAEARWPAAAAVAAAIALAVFVPHQMRFGPGGVLPGIEGLLLLALLVRDHGTIDRRSSLLRALSIGLVCLLVVAALWATAFLVRDLIEGGPETNSAGDLLRAGAIVWGSNTIASALLYWELDGGGPAARARRLRPHPDLAFPQHMNPNIAPPGWRPRFIDYLYLGITNALALSPTDVMPLAPWAKIAMALQSMIALMIIGLVIARAVNVLA